MPMEEDRMVKKQNREEKKIEREKRQIRCNSLKDQQRHFQRASGLYNLDKDGKRVYLSHEDRRKSEQRLQKNINKACR